MTKTEVIGVVNAISNYLLVDHLDLFRILKKQSINLSPDTCKEVIAQLTAARMINNITGCYKLVKPKEVVIETFQFKKGKN